MTINFILDKEWEEAERILSTSAATFELHSTKALWREAQFLATKVRQGIRDQAPGGQSFKPLSPLTLAVRRFMGKRSTKALIVDADLLRSIKARKIKKGAYFIGVLRTAKGRTGEKLVNVAEIQEFGTGPIVIEVTAKMRAFLAAAFSQELGGVGGGGGGFTTGIIITQVPARPFFRPVFEKFGKPEDVAARFWHRLGKSMGGQLGYAPKPPDL